jgi:hypothetical protein
MTEGDIMRTIQLDLANGPVRLLRNNAGMLKNQAGNIVRFGVGGVGGSDLLGWRTITIGPEHIGQQLAVFAAIEVKAPRGKVTQEQANFIERVQQYGGLAGVARCTDDARQILKLP